MRASSSSSSFFFFFDSVSSSSLVSCALVMALSSSKFLKSYGYDLLLGSIAAFYVFTVPYTKVEESFNVQATHDILYHRHHIDKYDHLEFPGVVPRTFLGALLVSTVASPVILIINLMHFPKLYALFAVRMALGCIVLSTLRLFRLQVRDKFGQQVEAFFVILTTLQFHLLFYCSRPLPNIFALGVVNLAYAFWLKGKFYSALNCLIFATVVFRCDILLLICPLGLELLLTKSITIWGTLKHCVWFALVCIGLTILIDSIFWRRLLWPEFEVFWFNSVLNRSSEWDTSIPLLGVFLDRRVPLFIIPVFSFVLVYSKLPHKELRFIISSVPIFNLSAAIAANRIYNNRGKSYWKLLYFMMLGLLLVSLGCTAITFMASYENYPSGHALRNLHQIEEGIPLGELVQRNFTYLITEHPAVDGFRCLFTVDGFSKVRFQPGFPPISMVREPKVYAHGNESNEDVINRNWPGCFS
ncbi:hypothetical protein G4B88_021788 [Cannabis sativa]|uniref:Mannosyltransferase n=1 Tax=Cannabis sativa TaxID=3483 RepID=A0A7J6F2R5_CANSA|nr:hypothetical protein G4B88_021788 [Cannabis sativa]